jgi:hypothetical protein
LIKYKIRNLVTFLVKSELVDFYEMGYPIEIMDFNLDEKLDMCLNASVYDIENGTILKLAEG